MNDSYKNPFSGKSASTLDEKSILDYWCDPFSYQMFDGIREEDVYLEETNIVFAGGRATGKSMFLRYWSFPVQSLLARTSNLKFADNIKKNEGLGVYLRIRGATLRSLQGYGLSGDHWHALFTHFFELLVAREYAEALSVLFEEGSLSAEEFSVKFAPKLKELLDCGEIESVTDLMKELDRRIQWVDRFRGDVAFFRKPFQPDGRIFTAQSISFEIAHLIRAYFSPQVNVNVLILLDEYENFLEYQQILVNSILKFTEAHIKFRIGMRLEGFRTFKVVDKDDYIKEGREYRSVEFEEIISTSNEYSKFLMDIATRRLEAIPELQERGFTDIAKILAPREDLELEAAELTKNEPDKAYEYFLKTLLVPKEQLNQVRIANHPLMELMNFIWLYKGVSPDATRKSMDDYLSKRKTEAAKKYGNDYVKKYKLSLMFLLCRIHKKRKKYYSFRTFMFLSSGIVGHFIELCRSTFAVAGWADSEGLILNGTISKEDQDTAAFEVSAIEKRQIHRIEDYGGELSTFVENIGNVFREYQRDFKMTYPETNQFTINIDSLRSKELEKPLRAAIKWSVVMRKPRMQRSGPSEGFHDIYTLNRIFSPIFQISYRTRGGESLNLDQERLAKLTSSKLDSYTEFLPFRKTPRKKKSLNNTLFELDE
ncbi:MAG: hypothetical protein ACKVRN_11480 [Pyrinomonadaceae bacterium]